MTTSIFKFTKAASPMAKWDTRFCELAKFVSEWSKDPNAKVGAVIVSRRGGDISVGYNGFPMGVEDSMARLMNTDEKLEMIVHAEQNALIAVGSRAQGSTIFVWGKPVCARCAGSIIQAGVKRVVALTPESVGADSKWRATGERAKEMFEEAGVEFDFYTVVESTAPAAPAAPGAPAAPAASRRPRSAKKVKRVP